jgi:hypothetical protein
MHGASFPIKIDQGSTQKAHSLMQATTGSRLFDSQNGELPKLIYFSSQIVAGINYNMIYEIRTSSGDTGYICATIFQALPSNGEKLTCTNYEMSLSLKIACKNCHATLDQTPNNCNTQTREA